jgi:release factor glutamine methyltransferase
VLMVLCDGCDIPMIESMAKENHFSMKRVLAKRNLVETNYIYTIKTAF